MVLLPESRARAEYMVLRTRTRSSQVVGVPSKADMMIKKKVKQTCVRIEVSNYQIKHHINLAEIT